MDQLSFTVADFAVLAILALSGLFAYSRGLVREALGLAAWLGAALVALYGYSIAQPYTRRFITVEWVADIVTAVVLFLAAFILISVLSRPLAGSVRDSGLRPLDRTLGLFFGLLRGAVIVCLAYMVLNFAWPQMPAEIREARSRPYVEQGVDLIRTLLPKGSLKAGEDAASGAKDRVEKGIEAERAIRELTRPQDQPAAPGTPPPPAYDDKERRQLDRLIESTQ